MTAPNGDVRRQALEAVLGSETFRRAERLRQILRYLGEEFLQGRGAGLGQKAIAHEVFGIPPGSRTDYQFVRRSVNELRKKLAVYYSGEGAARPIRISIPQGAYQPLFEELTGPAGLYAPVQEPREAPPGGEAVPVSNGTALLDDAGERPPEEAPPGPAPVPVRQARWSPRLPRRVRNVLLVAGACVVLGGLAILLGLRGNGGPCDTVSHGNLLQVLDNRGRILWSAELEGPVHPQRLIADLDADGTPEVVAATGSTTPGDWEGFLYGFSAGGRQLWRLPLAPAREVPFPDSTLRSPYWLTDLKAVRLNGDGALDLLALVHHVKWFPTRVLRISAAGKVAGSYWHPGHLNAMALQKLPGGKKVLLLGGCNNGYGRRPALLWLDTDRMDGRGPALLGGQYEAQGLPLAQHLAYVLLPRTEPSRSYPDIVPQVAYLESDPDGTLRAHTLEPYDGTVSRHAVVYTFDRALHLTEVVLSDPLRSTYEELARRKGLPPPDFEKVQADLAAGIQVWRDGAFVPLGPGESAISPEAWPEGQ